MDKGYALKVFSLGILTVNPTRRSQLIDFSHMCRPETILLVLHCHSSFSDVLLSGGRALMSSCFVGLHFLLTLEYALFSSNLSFISAVLNSEGHFAIVFMSLYSCYVHLLMP